MRRSANTFVMLLASTLAFMLSVLIPSGAALAQGMHPSEPGYSAAPGTVNPQSVDDATLKHTANAYVKVRQIVQNAQQALKTTNDDTQKQQIVQHTESEKLAAVKAEGLQPQTYNQVIELVQADKNLQQKFLSYVNEANNSPSKAE